MGTPYSILINSFLNRVERDIDFFQYLNLSDADAMALVERRALAFLGEACGRILLEAPNRSDFGDRNDLIGEFGFDLTEREKYLVASLMYERYMSRDIAKLKALSRDYTSTDLRVFSPDEARKTFKQLYQTVCDENSALLEIYRSTDSTGMWRPIGYAESDIDASG